RTHAFDQHISIPDQFPYKLLACFRFQIGKYRTLAPIEKTAPWRLFRNVTHNRNDVCSEIRQVHSAKWTGTDSPNFYHSQTFQHAHEHLRVKSCQPTSSNCGSDMSSFIRSKQTWTRASMATFDRSLFTMFAIMRGPSSSCTIA